MEKIITHSPLQLRQENLDKHERMLSLLTAESINILDESLNNKKRTRLDVWNTFTKEGDSQFTSDTERNKNITELIDARYDILKANYKIDVADREVVRDDSVEYIAIVKETLAQLLSEKIISVKDADFHICENCGYIIAPSEANIGQCPNCSSDSLGIVKKSGLFLNNDPTDLSVFEHIDFNVLTGEAKARVRSAMLNMPLSCQISKHRNFGVNLSEFGVSDEFVLDPKVGIALSGKVIREAGLGEITLSVQGIDSLKNNVPFTLLLDKKTKTKFLNIGLVPSFSTPELERYGSLFYFPFLSLVVAAKGGKMSAGEIEQLYKEFSATKKKFDSCVYALQSLSVSFAYSDTLNSDKKVGEFITELRVMLQDNKLRDVVHAMRSFLYDWLSKEYVRECKEQSRRPDVNVLAIIEQVLNTVFKS